MDILHPILLQFFNDYYKAVHLNLFNSCWYPSLCKLVKPYTYNDSVNIMTAWLYAIKSEIEWDAWVTGLQWWC
jgi:hypothetical protein